MVGGRAGDASEPRVFALLAALTPPGAECVLYDERLEPVPVAEPTDLVALSVDTFSARRAYQLASEYQRRGTPVVLGGHHPTLAPEEALCFAHTVVVGDAEGVWPGLVEDARAGRLELQIAIQQADELAILALQTASSRIDGCHHGREAPPRSWRQLYQLDPVTPLGCGGHHAICCIR